MAHTKSSKSVQSMTEERFWDIVEKLNWKDACKEKQPHVALKKILMRDLTSVEVSAFREIAHYFKSQLYEYLNSRITQLGDDSFGDLLCHIIGMGKKEYEKCLNSAEYAKNTYVKSFVENFFYCIPSAEDYEKASDNYDGFFKWANKIHRSLKRCNDDGIIRHALTQDMPLPVTECFICLMTFFDRFEKTHDYKMFKESGRGIVEDVCTISKYIKAHASSMPHKLFMTNEQIWFENNPKVEIPEDWDDYGTEIFHNHWIVSNLVSDVLECRKETY